MKKLYICTENAEKLSRNGIKKGMILEGVISTSSILLFKDNKFIGFGNKKYFKELTHKKSIIMNFFYNIKNIGGELWKKNR